MFYQWLYPTPTTPVIPTTPVTPITTVTSTITPQFTVKHYPIIDIQESEFERKLNSIRMKIVDLIELDKDEIHFMVELDKKNLKKMLKLQNDNIRTINDYIEHVYQIPYKKLPKLTPKHTTDE